jgi:hypothetical protein
MPKRRCNFKFNDVARLVAAARAAGLVVGSVEITPRHDGDATIRVYSQDSSLAVALAMELEAKQKAVDETGPMHLRNWPPKL